MLCASFSNESMIAREHSQIVAVSVLNHSSLSIPTLCENCKVIGGPSRASPREDLDEARSESFGGKDITALG